MSVVTILLAFWSKKKHDLFDEKYFEGKSEYSVAWNQRNVWRLHVSGKL